MSSTDKLHIAYEQLVGRPLTPEQVSEAKFNIVKYVETLIEMDKQHKDWLNQQSTEVKESRKDS